MAKSKDKAAALKEKYKIDDSDINELLTLFDGDIGEVGRQLKGASEEITKWQTWYKDNQPAIENNEKLAQDAVVMRGKFAELEKAGFKFGQQTPDPEVRESSAFDEDGLKREIFGITGQISMELMQAGIRHLKNFNEELDLDALQKLVQTKGLTVKSAYDEMTRTRYEEKHKKEEDDRVNKLVEERVNIEKAKLSAPRLTPQSPTFLTDYINKGEKAAPTMSREEEFSQFLTALQTPTNQ